MLRICILCLVSPLQAKTKKSTFFGFPCFPDNPVIEIRIFHVQLNFQVKPVILMYYKFLYLFWFSLEVWKIFEPQFYMYLSFSARIPVFVLFCQNSMYFIFPDRCQEMTRPEGDSQELLEMSKNIPDLAVISASLPRTKKVSFSRLLICLASCSFQIFI